MDEKDFVQSLVSNYVTSDNSSQSRSMRNLLIRAFAPYLRQDGRALELGCEVGYMTQLISPLVKELQVVDASEEFLEAVKKRNLVNVSCYCSLFEDLTPEPKAYDYIFMSHVLEHLQDPDKILKMVHKALAPSGRLFVAVPNALALSRQLAQAMGLIDDLYALTPNDIRGGHRRVYDHRTLNLELVNNGFEIIESGGVFLKPFADFQLDEMIDRGLIGQSQIDGLYKLGFVYPEFCADCYAIVGKK
jgi:2-polyprenyl-3-methyl-5-hydroxy-6-metoxy-1,4-benzoquinol methylase